MKRSFRVMLSRFSALAEDKKEATSPPTRGMRGIRASLGVRITLPILTSSLFFCQGCLVPMRAPTRSIGPGGVEVKGKIDLGFIQAGKTNRDEVIQKLSWMNRDIKDQRFFLGRWSSSSWGTDLIVAMPALSGVGYDKWDRHWGSHNILVEFDDKDVVKRYRVFPDSELVRELSARVAENPGPPLDLSKPIKVSIQHLYGPKKSSFGEFLLGIDSLSYCEDGDEPKHDFQISPKEIQDFRLAGSRVQDSAQWSDQTIYLSRRTAVGQKMTIRLRVGDLMLLVKYLSQTK